MAKQKKPVHRVQMTEGKRNIIHQLLEEYDIETAEDIQDALKDLLGGTIKEMMEAEMDEHLGYGNLSVPIVTIIEMVISEKESTAVMEQWRLMFRKIVSLPSNHRL